MCCGAVCSLKHLMHVSNILCLGRMLHILFCGDVQQGHGDRSIIAMKYVYIYMYVYVKYSFLGSEHPCSIVCYFKLNIPGMRSGF